MILLLCRIIPTHQIDQYIDVLLHKKLPLVDLYSLYKTDLLNIENNTNIYKKINSNEVDCSESSKPIDYNRSELIEMNKMIESSPTSSKQQEQYDFDVSYYCDNNNNIVFSPFYFKASSENFLLIVNTSDLLFV